MEAQKKQNKPKRGRPRIAEEIKRVRIAASVAPATFRMIQRMQDDWGDSVGQIIDTMFATAAQAIAEEAQKASTQTKGDDE